MEGPNIEVSWRRRWNHLDFQLLLNMTRLDWVVMVFNNGRLCAESIILEALVLNFNWGTIHVGLLFLRERKELRFLLAKTEMLFLLSDVLKHSQPTSGLINLCPHGDIILGFVLLEVSVLMVSPNLANHVLTTTVSSLLELCWLSMFAQTGMGSLHNNVTKKAAILPLLLHF